MCGSDDWTTGYFLSRQSGLLDGFYNNTSANFSEVTPMVSLTRSLGDESMVYFLYAEGFLSGSFNDELNTSLVPELAPLLTYDPEHVNNYEVGYKGTFADGRIQLSSALFYMAYEDKQESISIDNADGRFGGDPQIGITTNAATVDIVGIELELRTQPWDGGYLSLDVGHLKNEYGEFTSFDPDAVGGTIDRSDMRIKDYSPEWTVGATLEHAFQLANGATLTPQLGVYWQDDYDFSSGIDGGPPSYCFQGGFAKIRTRVTYDPPEATWQASLFGSNISDERYYEVCGGSRSGVYDYRYGQPDTWGLEFTYDWGA
jgi:iron complex outermembrane receptor protein